MMGKGIWLLVDHADQSVIIADHIDFNLKPPVEEGCQPFGISVGQLRAADKPRTLLERGQLSEVISM